MITAARCREIAGHYKALSCNPNISESRAFLLRNIAKSFLGSAGQLDRLYALTKDEETLTALPDRTAGQRPGIDRQQPGLGMSAPRVVQKLDP
ncbi:hypothetical protein [Bradyrhizobium sp. McL0616]|uniref:hypothetical protein n=1 Tax=Bradyrhizobium sp. McL0616 TaxID=3415674 RepID=UPI003CEAB020